MNAPGRACRRVVSRTRDRRSRGLLQPMAQLRVPERVGGYFRGMAERQSVAPSAAFRTQAVPFPTGWALSKRVKREANDECCNDEEFDDGGASLDEVGLGLSNRRAAVRDHAARAWSETFGGQRLSKGRRSSCCEQGPAFAGRILQMGTGPADGEASRPQDASPSATANQVAENSTPK